MSNLYVDPVERRRALAREADLLSEAHGCLRHVLNVQYCDCEVGRAYQERLLELTERAGSTVPEP